LESEQDTSDGKPVLRPWIIAACVLCLLLAVLALISPRFAYEKDTPYNLIWVVVALLLVSGLVYLSILWTRREDEFSWRLGFIIISAGFIFRLIMMPSTPMLEDDYYRYLWDGAVTAEGFNPFKYAPESVTADADAVPPQLKELAVGSHDVIDRINFPGLRTIYPPTAQAAFAVAYLIKPWSLMALKAVFLLCDTAVLILLVALLREMKLSLLLIAFYWWNPLLIKEIYNSCHMELVLLPFLMLAVLLAVRGCIPGAAAALAFAAGAKVWPVVLLPLSLRAVFSKPGRLLVSAPIFLVIVGALFLPVWFSGLEDDSGFTAYTKQWEMNDALFMVLIWISQLGLRLAGFAVENAFLFARAMAVLILIAVIAANIRREPQSPAELCRKALMIVTALFLISPTGFPWYYLWMLPLLTLRPRFSLLLLTPLLALYYLRFYFKHIDAVNIFDNGIVWLEFSPVIILFVMEWFKERRKQIDEKR